MLPNLVLHFLLYALMHDTTSIKLKDSFSLCSFLLLQEGVATSIVVRAAQGGKLVLVGASSGGIERTVDFTGIKVVKIRSHVLRGGGLLCLCLSHRYDLLLRVKGQFAEWQACLSSHLESLSIDVQEERRSEKEIVSELVTKQDRQEMVEFFLRGVFRESHLTRRKGNPRLNLLQRNSKKKREVSFLTIISKRVRDLLYMHRCE